MKSAADSPDGEHQIVNIMHLTEHNVGRPSWNRHETAIGCM